jgi:Rubisco accumulation factor 1 alpha helical domain
MQEAVILARAVKEHERREGVKLGFSKSPGDCLAFKFYRDVRSRHSLLPTRVHTQPEHMDIAFGGLQLPPTPYQHRAHLCNLPCRR